MPFIKTRAAGGMGRAPQDMESRGCKAAQEYECTLSGILEVFADFLAISFNWGSMNVEHVLSTAETSVVSAKAHGISILLLKPGPKRGNLRSFSFIIKSFSLFISFTSFVPGSAYIEALFDFLFHTWLPSDCSALDITTLPILVS